MPIQRANDRVEWIVSVKGRPGHWPAGSSLRAESGPLPEIFPLPGRYVRTGHYARTHIGRSSPGARFAEAPVAGMLEITAFPSLSTKFDPFGNGRHQYPS